MNGDSIYTVYILAGGIVCLVIGYYIGRQTERTIWNRLIDWKVIPKPPYWVRKHYPDLLDVYPSYGEPPPNGAPEWNEIREKYITRFPGSPW